MKTWIMFALIFGVLAIGAVFVLSNSKTVSADYAGEPAEGCPYGGDGSTGCPYNNGVGGCTQESNCGLDTCAAKYGGGCGCTGR